MWNCCEFNGVVFDEVVLQIELDTLKCPCSYLIPGLFVSFRCLGESWACR